MTTTTTTTPRQLLSVTDGVFLAVGMVIGVGIFKAPSIVAGHLTDPADFEPLLRGIAADEDRKVVLG